MTELHRAGPLFTDLYELTMAASYFAHRIFSTATFSLFIRGNYLKRNFFVAAGLEDVLNELEIFRFSEKDITYLQTSGAFSKDFLSYLAGLRFSGKIFAMPEGTIFFADEPVLEVTAPIIEAQLIETFLLNTIGFQSMIASKAARCVHVAGNRPLIDFSLRRTQGQDAGHKVARSTYIAGFVATSNVLAGQIYGIPISGTMAHSYIEAFSGDLAAFSAYSETFPDTSIFLIDTYNTIDGAKHAVTVAKQMKENGHSLIGVRLDSGDMVDLSQKVRKIFDDAGLSDVKIFASSGFDEFKIAEVISKGAKIDAFGVGTKVGVSADAPYLDAVYKMVRFKNRDVRKLSPGKITLAGEKQVFRKSDPNGRYLEDIIGLRGDIIKQGMPLLKKVMENVLDNRCKSILEYQAYPVKLSENLKRLQESA